MFEGATPMMRRLRNLWLMTWENYRIEPVPRSVRLTALWLGKAPI
jgi:hypothetical protein